MWLYTVGVCGEMVARVEPPYITLGTQMTVLCELEGDTVGDVVVYPPWNSNTLTDSHTCASYQHKTNDKNPP